MTLAATTWHNVLPNTHTVNEEKKRTSSKRCCASEYQDHWADEEMQPQTLTALGMSNMSLGDYKHSRKAFSKTVSRL